MVIAHELPAEFLRAAEQNPALSEFCQLTLWQYSLTQLVSRACDLIRGIRGCDEAVVWTGHSDSEVGRAAEQALREAVGVQAIGSGEVLVVEDALSEARFDASSLVEQGFVGAVVAPLGPASSTTGVLAALFRTPRSITDADVALIRSVAGVLGAAAAGAKANVDERATSGVNGPHGSQLSEAQSLTGVGSWEVNRETGEMHWSDEMYRLAGLPPRSCVPTLDLVARLVGMPVAGIRSVIDALTEGEAFDREHEMFGLDGVTRFVESRGRLSEQSRGVVIGTMQDVTAETVARREHEELRQSLARVAFEWRMTFDSIPAPVLLLDQERRVDRLNAAALTLSRFADYRDALGKKIEDLGPGAVWRELKRVSQMAIDRREGVALRTRDAAGRHWDVVASAWQLKGTVRITLFATDVTAFAAMQETLQRNERMSAMGALVVGVAHEVRNPLFAISATVDAIEATGSHDIQSRFTAALRDQVTRMNELLQDLLEYGRPQIAEYTREDIAPLVRLAQSSVRTLLEKDAISVAVDVPPDLPAIFMDRRRLLQVFENLLRNAVQHAPRGSSVDVRAEAREGMVTVQVCDRGPGFENEDLSRVFEPFFTRRRGGTGLGLSLAQRIVEDHEGSIEASNRPGGGGMMTMRLPICRPEPAG